MLFKLASASCGAPGSNHEDIAKRWLINGPERSEYASLRLSEASLTLRDAGESFPADASHPSVRSVRSGPLLMGSSGRRPIDFSGKVRIPVRRCIWRSAGRGLFRYWIRFQIVRTPSVVHCSTGKNPHGSSDALASGCLYIWRVFLSAHSGAASGATQSPNSHSRGQSRTRPKGSG